MEKSWDFSWTAHEEASAVIKSTISFGKGMKIFDKNTFKVERLFFFFNISQEQSRSAVCEKEIINQDGFTETHHTFSILGCLKSSSFRLLLFAVPAFWSSREVSEIYVLQWKTCKKKQFVEIFVRQFDFSPIASFLCFSVIKANTELCSSLCSG